MRKLKTNTSRSIKEIKASTEKTKARETNTSAESRAPGDAGQAQAEELVRPHAQHHTMASAPRFRRLALKVAATAKSARA